MLRVLFATVLATLALAAPAMAESTVKSNMVFPTVEQRDDWISDANQFLSGRAFRQDRQAFIGAAEDIGPTVARMKFTLLSDPGANALAGLLIVAGNNRGVLTGSFVRATNDAGTVLREFYW